MQIPINDQLRGKKIPCAQCNTPVDVPLARPAASRWANMPNEAGNPNRSAGNAPNNPSSAASQSPDSIPGRANPSTPLPVPTFSSVTQPIDPSFPLQPNKHSITSISNHAIIITAVSCLLGLTLVIGTVVLFNNLTKKAAPRLTVELVPEEILPGMQRTYFQEGYSMMLPTGFKQQSREETQRGYIVYRFRSEEGYRFTLAIIPNESIDRFTVPPQDYSEALVKSVRELSQDVDGEVQPMPVTADRMPASLFQYYEKETFRGVTFIYLMVAMDRGRKLVLKMDGKYGGYHEDDENIAMPNHWYDSLLTLRSAPRPNRPNESLQP